MIRLHVPLSGGRDYPLYIGANLLQNAGEWLLPLAPGKRAVILTQPSVARRHLAPLVASLGAAGFAPPDVLTFPGGERHKHLATVARLCKGLYNLTPALDRKTLVIALGGGVVGDVAGFAAAIYLRGLPYVQIPTTLLAMVDSSVGGKTGVDFHAGKNLIGAFHQPRLVIADMDTLQTLPAREMRAGMAEVIKYGIIREPELLAYCTTRGDVTGWDADAIAHVVHRSCAIKADVVSRDEYETTGLRAILNFGHTVGHALESATGYRRFRHGEAIAIGMRAACCIGEAAGVTSPDAARAVIAALQAHGLPTAVPADIAPESLLNLLGRDKKAEGGRARWVLARSLGHVETGVEVPDQAVQTGLKQAYETAR